MLQNLLNILNGHYCIQLQKNELLSKKTLYEGKFNTILVGVLVEFKKYNF
jgi:hypothetical protein